MKVKITELKTRADLGYATAPTEADARRAIASDWGTQWAPASRHGYRVDVVDTKQTGDKTTVTWYGRRTSYVSQI